MELTGASHDYSTSSNETKHPETTADCDCLRAVPGNMDLELTTAHHGYSKSSNETKNPETTTADCDCSKTVSGNGDLELTIADHDSSNADNGSVDLELTNADWDHSKADNGHGDLELTTAVRDCSNADTVSTDLELINADHDHSKADNGNGDLELTTAARDCSNADNGSVDLELTTAHHDCSETGCEKVDVSITNADGDCFKADNLTETHAATSEDSPLSKSMDFMSETKYVMLNFMGLIPPDIYQGHISASPESSSIEHQSYQKFVKSHHFLPKSKSFDIGLHSRKANLKHIGKLKSMQRDLDSPASEDNVNYRYKYNWNRLDSPDGPRFISDPGSPNMTTELLENSKSAHEFGSHSSLLLSQRKNERSHQRQYSDISSSGDLSYMSDADDEFEDSNASSIFSLRSISSRDGFLDLCRSVQILPTVLSQPEGLDEEDSCMIKADDGTVQSNTEKGYLGTSREQLKSDLGGDCETCKMAGPVNVTLCDTAGSRRQTADRSKLKLSIPREPLQLDDILLSLQSELTSELDELESEFEEALQTARNSRSRTPLTPQSEAARVLARIGDEVKVQYDAQLMAAVNRLTYQQITSLSYQQFKDLAETVVDTSLPGWRQVALLMVFGQKMMWGAVQQGHTQFGDIVDYCSLLVSDFAADFIIKQGGWGSVMNFDPSQSSDTQSSCDIDTSPDMLVEYFISHNITQVESENCIEDTTEQTVLDKQNMTDNIEVVESLTEGNREHACEPNINSADQLLPESAYNSKSSSSKIRYASSVGFDYIDYMDAIAGTDIQPESEQDVSQVFSEPDNIGEKKNCEPVEFEGGKILNNTPSQEESENDIFTPENQTTAAIPNDHSATIAQTDFDKCSVYIKQTTPSTAFVESTIETVNGNSSNNSKSLNNTCIAYEEAYFGITSGESCISTAGREPYINTTGGESCINTTGGEPCIGPTGGESYIDTTGGESCIDTTGGKSYINTTGGESCINTTGREPCIGPTGGESYIGTTGGESCIDTTGGESCIDTTGGESYINTTGEDSGNNNHITDKTVLNNTNTVNKTDPTCKESVNNNRTMDEEAVDTLLDAFHADNHIPGNNYENSDLICRIEHNVKNSVTIDKVNKEGEKQTKESFHADGDHENAEGSTEYNTAADEVTNESSVHVLVRQMGVKVAALALGLLVIGISVRLANLNR